MLEYRRNDSPVLVDCKSLDSVVEEGPMEDSFEALKLMEFLELMMVDYYLWMLKVLGDSLMLQLKMEE